MIRLFLFTLCFSLVSVGFAQRVKFQSTGLVEFSPTQDGLIDTILCSGCNTLEPSALSADIAVRLLRQGKQPQTLSVGHDGWTPNGELNLEARYTVTGNQSGTLLVSDWIELGSFNQNIFSARDPVTDVEVAYRLRLTGQEQAGTYETSVRYSSGSSTVSHRVRVVIPTVIALRVKGKTGSTVGSGVSFDYGSTDALAYMQAVTSGEPLRLTSSSLGRVEVYTNSPKGYRVTLQLEFIDGPPDGALNANDIYLFGSAATSQVIMNRAATEVFETIVLPQDFSIHIDGSEASGNYVFSVRYSAVVNP